MQACPNCGSTYEDKDGKCLQCADDDQSRDIGCETDWAILTTVSNDIEFEMVAGLLEGAHIPAVRKVNGIDGYLKVLIGVPIAGIDILVPRDKLDEAEQLLNAEVRDEDLG